ncbi:hypothetical protein [Paenibacillus ginsengarvi]|uniref:Uncharacterized protein n=1 Tax=Paenibacillus ginsengarvi TaxID=400777 RepID=A0A3B0C5B2_9BACL|nr:hypothetical protein [Paenibacillus ginsengarvi]RKN79209.1 hypothetical protein D7M11_21240 [Paenibacillus ginsengarvi]
MNETSPIDHERLLVERVRDWEPQYNPETKLLRVPFSSPGYHTTLKDVDYVHGTYINLIYALALLDTELPEYEQRAFDIIETIIALQDTDRSRSTFGIWPWFYEEPLEQMSPPDWNWADFCGKQLLLAEVRHGARLGEPLRSKVKLAISCACDAIIKRDVGPSYTNIAIMGAFVTLVAGEHYGIGAYAEYGLKRLAKFYDFTLELQAFQEYNSPTYAVVSIVELSRIRALAASERAKRMSDELLDLAWEMTAEHFHPVTGQWAGPHSRGYRTLLGGETKSFLHVATGGRIGLPPAEKLHYSAEWYRGGIACPQRFLERFTARRKVSLRRQYVRDSGRGLEKWATTYMTPQYAIGTFRKEILWNQCRVLVGYFDNSGSPTYVHLRFLHDGYDFSSAVFESVQAGPDILFGIRFITDGGDTHPSLDKTNGSIRASDLRLRLEIGGCLDRVSAASSESGATIAIDGLPIELRTLFASLRWGGDVRLKPAWRVLRESDTLGVDYVLYEGEKQTFDLRAIESGALLFALSVGKPVPEYSVETDEERGFAAAVRKEDGSQHLEMKTRPTEVL